MVEAKCQDLKPVVECHHKCAWSHECHEKCPLPDCDVMAGKIKEAIKCHGDCGHNYGCHHRCRPRSCGLRRSALSSRRSALATRRVPRATSSAIALATPTVRTWA
eukprot:SRR837773.21569.p1 GENE.SRR837773.21569~~SRR837773.21569.p1  ORF type:complete len:122 (+),score=15.35 SRR837773.21569:52-366(+)